MRYVFLLVLLLCSTCYGAEERVLKLPEGSNKWYISVVGDADDAQYQSLIQRFQDGKLAELRKQCHFLPVTTDNPMFEHYRPTIKGTPTVRVQDAVGHVIFEASRDQVPDDLYNAIANAAQRHRLFPLRPHPSPKPTPSPNPKPVTPDDPAPAPVGDGGTPDIEPTVPDWGIGICVSLLVAGTVLGLVSARRNQSKS
jgi:hypothetical protein